MSNAYDELNDFQGYTKRMIQRLNSELTKLSARVDAIAKAIDELQDYSYRFNVKIIGVPDPKSSETALQTSELCLKIFREMGAEVSTQDIDTAHRVPSRNASSGPRPIVCKFTGRLAKDDVILHRRDAGKANAINLALPDGSDVSGIRIFDHLTPKFQNLLYEAKKVKGRLHFQFCWAKGSSVLLRKTSDSRVYKFRDINELERFTIEST